MAISFLAGYPVAIATKASHQFPEKQSISESGYVREIALGTVVLSHVSLVFTLLTEAEKNALVDWLYANRSQEINIPVSTGSYTGRIDKSRSIEEGMAGGSSFLWEVSFDFYGVRQ